MGKLILNPVLDITPDEPGALHTEFMFRTAWGAYEDADMMAYTDRWGTIDKTELRNALTDPQGAAASNLVRRFALIGASERFVRDDLG